MRRVRYDSVSPSSTYDLDRACLQNVREADFLYGNTPLVRPCELQTKNGLGILSVYQNLTMSLLCVKVSSPRYRPQGLESCQHSCQQWGNGFDMNAIAIHVYLRSQPVLTMYVCFSDGTTSLSKKIIRSIKDLKHKEYDERRLKKRSAVESVQGPRRTREEKGITAISNPRRLFAKSTNAAKADLSVKKGSSLSSNARLILYSGRPPLNHFEVSILLLGLF